MYNLTSACGQQSTQNGNPLACAAGMATIQLLTQPGFLDEVAEKGQVFSERVARKTTRPPLYRGNQRKRINGWNRDPFQEF